MDLLHLRLIIPLSILFISIVPDFALCSDSKIGSGSNLRSLFNIDWNSTSLDAFGLKPLNQTELKRRRELLGSGYWHTNGNAIVDSKGNRVWFSGVNWQGFETENCIVDGLYIPTGESVGRSINTHIKQMKSLGFNLIRIAFAGPCVQSEAVPLQSAFDSSTNPELDGMTSLQVLDRVITLARRAGMRVILDYHRVKPIIIGKFAHEPGLWYDQDLSEDYWINTWVSLAKRYNKNSAVVGFDLFNEPHNNEAHSGPFWSADFVNEPFNWRTAARRAANAIQEVNPNVLIFVEGLWGEACWWGSNLVDVKKYPLNLKIPYKLVYSIHEYGPAVLKSQPWFADKNFPDNLPAFWDNLWGFVHNTQYAPIWVGEFGSLLLDAPESIQDAEIKWLRTFVNYIGEKQIVWTWFTWGPNSVDTGGILKSNFYTPNYDKLSYVTTIMHYNFGPSQGFNSKIITTKMPSPLSSPPPPPAPLVPPSPPDEAYRPFSTVPPPPAYVIVPNDMSQSMPLSSPVFMSMVFLCMALAARYL